ncbi:MAG: DUF429 domain-containing protein [Candidatus Saccharicenans sp.]|uniref:DUF429 domain-containing protein n=1 Tax=Candidatus Saccharicenans sp. TaxID=2819258 RepID=UPI004049ECA0
MPEKLIKIAGIDLAGSPRRPTGFCLIEGKNIEVTIVHEDEEIIDKLRKFEPALVAIDAPLSLPPGRRQIEDRGGGHFRSCDLALRERGIRFFPITLGPMRMLTARGIALKKRIQRPGCRVIEVYPGAAQEVWGLPRAGSDRIGLARGLEYLAGKEFSLRLSSTSKKWSEMTADELDAVSAALVGLLFFRNQAELYGRGRQIIVMPRKKKIRPAKTPNQASFQKKKTHRWG